MICLCVCPFPFFPCSETHTLGDSRRLTPCPDYSQAVEEHWTHWKIPQAPSNTHAQSPPHNFSKISSRWLVKATAFLPEKSSLLFSMQALNKHVHTNHRAQPCHFHIKRMLGPGSESSSHTSVLSNHTNEGKAAFLISMHFDEHACTGAQFACIRISRGRSAECIHVYISIQKAGRIYVNTIC